LNSTGIITDSIHGLSPELIQQYDIRVAPMGVNVNNKGYRDMVDIKPADIYKLFPVMKTPGTTNAASPGDFLHIYEDLARTTRSILFIGVSKTLSATYNIVLQTRGMFLTGHPDMRIELLDSKNCMGAVGFLVLEAARCSAAGKSLDEIISAVQGLMPRVKYLSVLNTLEFLVKIGRMPANVLNANTQNLRPVIGMNNNSGNIQNLSPVPQPQALEKLMEIAGKYLQPDKPVHVIFHYSENRQEAEELKRLFTARYTCSEMYMTEYSPAALCGTGLMTGLAFYQ
jgi:DegV family protein with EDD domain